MKLRLLGTGTSQGVPVIGCDCPVCTSTDTRDQRLRCSALISDGNTNILIDAGPDFRQQMLRANVRHLDAILLTHEHNDHVNGLDDVRPFNFLTGNAIKVFALPRVVREIRKRFEYIFNEYVPGLPRIQLCEINRDSVFKINQTEVRCIGVEHGKLPILGFRFNNLTYLTDVKTLQQSELKKMQDSQFLVISALHHHPHPTHMNLSECLNLIQALPAEKIVLTHISHQMGLSHAVQATLPAHVELGFDDMQFEF